MNERIQELAYQAEDWAIAHEAEHGSAYFQAEYTRKFAELIVRECMRYFNEDYQRDFDVKWREDLSIGIKNHFGVEE